MKNTYQLTISRQQKLFVCLLPSTSYQYKNRKIQLTSRTLIMMCLSDNKFSNNIDIQLVRIKADELEK